MAHRTYFTIVSLGYIVVVVLMTLVTIAGRPDSSVVLIQLGQLADSSGVYQFGFALAALVPVFALLLTAGVGLLVPPVSGMTRLAQFEGFVGAIFVLAYAPLSAFAYISQFTIFPQRLEQNFQRAERWYFTAPHSLPLALDLGAYALFGVGAVLISARLFRRRGALAWAALALCAAGATSIVAWLLHLAAADAAGTLSLISAALSVLFALGILIAAQQDEAEPVGDIASAGD